MNKVLDRLYQHRADHLIHMMRNERLDMVVAVCEDSEIWYDDIEVVSDHIKIVTLYDGMYNAPEVWSEVVETIATAITNGCVVGVGCAAGVSRSAAACAAYLIHIGMHPYEARELVVERTQGIINPVLWDQIKEWSAQRYGCKFNNGDAFKDI